MGYTLKYWVLMRKILEKEKGKRKTKITIFSQIMKDMECGSFRKMKEVSWDTHIEVSSCVKPGTRTDYSMIITN